MSLLLVKTEKSWLAGSPDGLVLNQFGDLILLEIKCPSSNEGKEISVPYLDLDGYTMQYELSQNDSQGRMYFTQVQILMYITGAKLTHFFVYSAVDYKLVLVHYDKKYL